MMDLVFMEWITSAVAHMVACSAKAAQAAGVPRNAGGWTMFWYLAYMGLLIAVVAVWALVAFRDRPPEEPSDSGTRDFSDRP